MADPARNIWAVQFHPEVHHTPQRNRAAYATSFFVSAMPSPTGRRHNSSSPPSTAIREQVGDGRAICALSGGVDSSVAAVLVDRAIGDRLTCVFVNNGVLRKNEFLQGAAEHARQAGPAIWSP